MFICVPTVGPIPCPLVFIKHAGCRNRFFYLVENAALSLPGSIFLLLVWRQDFFFLQGMGSWDFPLRIFRSVPLWGYRNHWIESQELWPFYPVFPVFLGSCIHHVFTDSNSLAIYLFDFCAMLSSCLQVKLPASFGIYKIVSLVSLSFFCLFKCIWL